MVVCLQRFLQFSNNKNIFVLVIPLLQLIIEKSTLTVNYHSSLKCNKNHCQK